MVMVKDITEVGAYVSLLEYDGMEGMVLLSELSKKRIRSINRLIRVGRQEVAAVLRVDEDKGYIDLSKRKVEPADVKRCEDRYNKAKMVHSVLRHVAEQHGASLEDTYAAIGWPMYRKHGHAYDAFELALGDSAVDIFAGIPTDEDMKQNLLAYIKRRMARQPVKVRSDIEVTCSTYEGIDAIKEALLEGEAQSTSDCPVRIKLIAPPMYVVTSMTLDRDAGIETLTKAIDCIGGIIRSKGYVFM
jgi:translation initiation factor 2 subunit 1